MAGRFTVETVFRAVDQLTAPVARMQSSLGRFSRATERNLRGVSKAVDSVVGGLKKTAGAAAKLGTIAFGGLATGVTLLVREFSKVEDAEAAFTPLIGGAEKARQTVEAINKTAASTPFQFETLASSVNQLLPVMNGNIENTIKTLRMLGDTAGGDAQKLDSITRGFTKSMLKGKVDLESLNMIAEAGVPIFQDLAEVMGVEVGEGFFKMISKGEVTTDQLIKTFEKMTIKGGKFFQGMEIASKTTSGVLSTLMDNVSLTAAEIGSVLAPTIKDILKQAIEVAQKVREWVKANKELIGTKFKAIVEGIKNAFMGLVDSFSALDQKQSVFDRLLDVINGLADAFAWLKENGAIIAKVIAGVVALSVALKAVQLVLAAINIIAMANPIGLLIAGVAAAAALIIANWEPIKEFFVDLWADIANIFEAGVAAIMKPIDFVVEKLNSLTSLGSEAFSAVAGLFGGDDGDESNASAARVVSPQERVARTIEESRSTSSAEVTIRDETQRAELTGGSLGKGLSLIQTGSF